MKNKNILLISVIILSIIGIIMITSSSIIWAEYKFDDPYKYMKSQILFFLISIILMFFISKIDYKLYYKYANIIFLLSLLLMILVLIPGIGKVRNGSRSWFGIGVFGIQPSEFMKLSIIIFISKYISIKKFNLFKILILIFLVFGLIMLQPDFGTGIIIVMISISLLYLCGVSMKLFFRLGFIGIIGIIILIIIAPYRLKRIISFINPWTDPLGSGFQIIMSLYAIGPGGLFGYGLGNSRQKHFYLPEPQTDFIFSIIVEELGILGAFIILFLFLLITYNGLVISKKCDNLFAKYVSFGITFWISFQAILNLCVVVGLIPVTGAVLRGIL
ncbi:MAG: putative lipid II flippase FtsW [Bacilli bacterium]|nr:putative lipid II flippase FtsW [Bacilli bacterium]